MGTVQEVLDNKSRYHTHHGDCLDWLDTVPESSVDAVVCDPPYAEIDRDYGRMTEADWEAFAHDLVRKSLRVLKPRGSAVFIIQPNSERIGRMRPWVFKFLAWCADELVRETGGRIGMVQDAWWWNSASPPTAHCQRKRGLMRPSVKPCVWIGPEDCYRDQDAVLWKESNKNVANRAEGRIDAFRTPSGVRIRDRRAGAVAAERGGVTPFNLLPFTNTDSANSAGSFGHGAGTPYNLAAWWVRYLCPPGGVVCDPCGGAMTMGAAALNQGRRFLGAEKEPHHYASGVSRLEACVEGALWLMQQADGAP